MLLQSLSSRRSPSPPIRWMKLPFSICMFLFPLSLSHSLYSYGFPMVFHRDLIESRDFLFCNKAKLYWFDKDGNQWKEKGASSVKFLQHKEKKWDKREHQRQEREKTNKIINVSVTVIVHICTVTVAIVHKCTILHLLMWVFFLLKMCKMSTFFYFAQLCIN